MTPLQMMRPPAPDEIAQLRASIEQHGVQVSVLKDENHITIDGHHREIVAAEFENLA